MTAQAGPCEHVNEHSDAIKADSNIPGPAERLSAFQYRRCTVELVRWWVDYLDRYLVDWLIV
jgi:hypothetical protein